MRQVNTIAEQELRQMFAEHGSHVGVCEALLKEADGMIEKMICQKETEAYWERLGIDKRATRQSKKKAAVLPGPKRVSLSELIAEQAREIEEDATLPSVEEAPEDQDEVEEETEKDRGDEEQDVEEQQQ